MDLSGVLEHSLSVTALVAIMMLAVEYANVLTRGVWTRALSASPSRQYLLAAILGATPGCLGAFAVVALYTHGMVSFGALVAAMIATSGDESFVMLALFPGPAVGLMAALAVVGWGAGIATDRLVSVAASPDCHELELHEVDACGCLPDWTALLRQLRQPSAARGALALGSGAFTAAVATGALGPPLWGWLRVTLLALGAFALFVVLSVPDHFLEEHLWRHTVLRHVPRILGWTTAALLLVSLADGFWPQATASTGARWVALASASLLGLVPESGPHLLFVNLYADGRVPLGVLVASSIVQDGHGMLPLLAHSRRRFLEVKAINLLVGLAIGALLLALGL